MLFVVVLAFVAALVVVAIVAIAWHSQTGRLPGASGRAAEWFLNTTAPAPAPVMTDDELETLLRDGNHIVEEPEWVPGVQHRAHAIANSPAVRDLRAVASRAVSTGIRPMTDRWDGETPILDDARMRELGFTDRVVERWYLCARVGPGVTLNVTIQKSTGQYQEYVLDEDFGQPAFYGTFRAEVRDQVIANVDEEVGKLRAAGLDITVDHTLYGVAGT
ncbi:hypothetical protein [Agromyces humi]|uniref:hypothetical protein n=1 Tax=Agromyces humi TaxID=1766800 RepID=UPI00135A62B8|nr:hypothetical protein [Agromyces humi]